MSTGPSARIDIAAARPAVAYSRDIFGHFVEHFHRQVYGGIFDPGSPLADERGFRTRRARGAAGAAHPERAVARRLLRLRLPLGRRDRLRTARRATTRRWRVTDPNTFGTDEFLAWCRELGAEPYICTNAGTGTPEEMADWLEYCNLPAGSRWADRRAANGHPDPYGVRFWSIGNENYGHWEIGAKSADEWARYVTEAGEDAAAHRPRGLLDGRRRRRPRLGPAAAEERREVPRLRLHPRLLGPPRRRERPLRLRGGDGDDARARAGDLAHGGRHPGERPGRRDRLRRVEPARLAPPLGAGTPPPSPLATSTTTTPPTRWPMRCSPPRS